MPEASCKVAKQFVVNLRKAQFLLPFVHPLGFPGGKSNSEISAVQRYSLTPLVIEHESIIKDL